MARYDAESEIWRFETANLVVTFNAEPEESDPADSFDSKADIKFARSGDAAAWFCAVVNVWLKQDGDTFHGDPPGEVVGSDVLGCCSYWTFREFTAGHRDGDPMSRNCSIMRAARGGNVVICHYFPDMVRSAVREARAGLVQLSQKLDGMALRAA